MDGQMCPVAPAEHALIVVERLLNGAGQGPWSLSLQSAVEANRAPREDHGK